ncbi:transposase [Mycobacteroides abscessus]|uniref:transposase n=1 Tax=Mycobacteroides abscessus TaxID=36809 RepID=UPI0027DF463E|nr:transposase [Mycobacteroides abscessus]
MSASRSVEGLARHARQVRAATRRKIVKAVREMHKKGLAINPNAVARYSGVARKTIYNHADLLKQIKEASTKPVLRPVETDTIAEAGSTIVAALQRQLLTQDTEHRARVAELNTVIKQRDEALAAAHGEILRLTDQLRRQPRTQRTADNPVSRQPDPPAEGLGPG